MKIPAVVSAAIFWAALCAAQSDTAQISGFIKDSSGSVIPGARVVITNEATGLERRTVTNESGYYVVSGLPPGFYTLTAEAPGFKRYVKTGNKLDANIASTVDATLEIGGVTETVEVVAPVAAVQSETATVGRLIESSQIENMMVSGRNPLFLALLKAGVRGGSFDSFSYGLTLGSLSINGSRQQDNMFTYDGAVAVRTRGNNSSIGVPDLETVQEIQVLTASYNAEYGRAAGGQIRFVTKSGGRNFHGSFYDYLRNDKLDANTWSRNRAGQPREANKFNQFGYVLSGPVYVPRHWNTDRSKLFFLWAQEWIKHRQENTTIQTVPSLAMRRGDFSELLSPANTFFGRVRVINDPTSGLPFPGNIIPAAMASPNGLGFLRAYPEPVPGFLQGTSNFIQTRPQPTNQRKDTVSLDLNPSPTHQFRFRHQNYSFQQTDAFRTGLDRAPMVWDRPNKVASLNYIWTAGPTTVNELLISASVDRVRMDIERAGERYSRSKYGINYPYIFPRGKLIPDRIPTVDIANLATLDGNYPPAKSAGPIYVISNSTTKIYGNHSLKFGVSFEHSGQNDFDQISTEGVPGGTNNQNGRFVFSDVRSGASTTGLAVANAAMGLFNTYAEIGERSYTPYRGQMFEWFVQDSWKATSRLRLEIGLRHTLQTPFWYSLWRNIAVFDTKRYDPAKAVMQDPRTGYILSGDQYNGIVIPGKGWPAAAKGRVAIADSGEFDRLFSGGKKTWGQFQKLDFQPRIGVAYSIGPKTVVRSGMGRFFPRPGMSGDMLLGGNPPFQPMASIANGQADNPSAGQPARFPFYFMTIEPVFKNPNAYNWNVTWEREVGFGTTLSLAYVGRVGLHLERQRDINQLPVGTTHNPANRGVNVNVLRPYKGFASIAMRETATRSKYDSFQLEVNRRFARGLGYGFAYTYSKCMDNASNFRARVYNAYDDRNFWGMCDNDTRHVAVANFVYEIPLLKNHPGLAGRWLGGWQVSGVMQFQTGTPLTIGSGDDFAGIGSTDLQPWEVTGNPKLPRSERGFSQGAADANFFFRTRDASGNPLFMAPALGTFSRTQNRNSLLHGPGLQSWNAAVFKNFAVTERQRVQLRGEFFNWPNHPNWGAPATNPKSATFGKVTGKTGNRIVQLSLRYSF